MPDSHNDQGGGYFVQGTPAKPVERALEKGADPGMVGAWPNFGSNRGSLGMRVLDGVRYIVSSVTPATWMSPNQPLAPIAQEAKGRRWDYRVGYNLWIQPRANEAIGFYQLRELADAWDLLRTIIENKKDLVVGAEWVIVHESDEDGEDPDKKPDPRIKEVTDFFQMPDKVHTWKTWLRACLEDMFVIDALTIYPRMTRGGKKPYAFDFMDGGLIKPVIDDQGRRPEPPDPAYQQILKGIQAVDYAADQLVYYPRNVRTNRVYGYGPVEQIIVTVNIGLRRQAYQLQYYTEGSVPDALIAVPEGWQPDQIAQYEEMWNATMQGNTAERRHAKFVPHGTTMFATREQTLKDEYDEWLARVACFAFGTNPQPFIKMMNRATAQTMKESADEEGTAPWLDTVSDFINTLIRFGWGYTDIKHVYKPLTEMDPVKRAQADDIDIKNGTKSVDEVRITRRLRPIGMPNAIYTATGAILVSDVINGVQSIAPAVPATDVKAPAEAKTPKATPAAAKAETQKIIKSIQDGLKN